MRQEAIQRVTDSVKTLIQPYLGKREFGGLCIRSNRLPYSPQEDVMLWSLEYNDISGHPCLVDVAYHNTRRVFSYIDEDIVITPDPQQALNFVRRRLENIQAQRKRFLEEHAKFQKEKEVPLEQAIDAIKESAKYHPECGPTKNEMEYYERFAHEVYQQ